MNLYVDNNKVSTLSTSSSPDKTGSQPVRVGANSLSANNFFTGSIDQVRVWNRALSSHKEPMHFRVNLTPMGSFYSFLSLVPIQTLNQQLATSLSLLTKMLPRRSHLKALIQMAIP